MTMTMGAKTIQHLDKAEELLREVCTELDNALCVLPQGETIELGLVRDLIKDRIVILRTDAIDMSYEADTLSRRVAIMDTRNAEVFE